MNERTRHRAHFFFVLITALLDFVLALLVDFVSGRDAITLLTTCIVGLSIAQMTCCLLLLMRDLSAWKLLIPGFVVALLYGLTVTIKPESADFNRVIAIQLITVAIGIFPVAIYRIVFVGLRVQFSLSILFGLMTAVTVLCAVAIRMNFDSAWFLRFFYLFLISAIPIAVAGFMLVGRRPVRIGLYLAIMSLLIVLSTITTLSSNWSDDIGILGQLCGFMSLYLLIAGIILLREIEVRTSATTLELSEPIVSE